MESKVTIFPNIEAEIYGISYIRETGKKTTDVTTNKGETITVKIPFDKMPKNALEISFYI